MILDSLKNSALYYGVNPRMQKAFERIASTDWTKVEPGIHELDGKDIYVNVMEREENVKLKLGDICKLVGYSESYLIRLFRAKLGTTPNREFTKIKMRYAAKMLRRTDYSVERIALLVGYSSKGYFYKLFSEEYGMLPYEYKKLNGERR